MKRRYLLGVYVLATILLMLIPYIKYGDFFYYDEAYRTHWTQCMEDYEKGQLYRHPAVDGTVTFTQGYLLGKICVNSPLGYLFPLPLKKVFGQWYFIALGALINLLTIVFLFLMYRIITKEEGKESLVSFLTLTALFVLLTLFNLLSNLEELLSGLLLMTGTYFLFYSKTRYREIVGGVALALGALAKIPMVMASGVIVAYYFLGLYQKQPKKKFWKSVLIILNSMLLIGAVFASLFPDFVLNQFGATGWKKDVMGREVGLPNALRAIREAFFPPPWHYSSLLGVLLLLLPAYLFIRKRNVFSVVSFLGIGITYLITSYYSGAFSEVYVNNYYRHWIVPLVPFAITGLVLGRATLKGKSAEHVLVWVMIALLLFIGLKLAHSTVTISRLDHEVAYPFRFIPEQEGRVLQETEKIRWFGGHHWPLDKYDYLSFTERTQFSNETEKTFMEAGLNYTRFVGVRLTELSEYARKISAGEYSLVNYGTSQQDSDILKLLYGVNRVQNLGEILPCKVFIPTTEDRCYTCRYGATVFFKNASHCAIVKEKMADYFNEHFGEICEKDYVAAEIFVKQVMEKNEIPLNQTCNSGATALLFYNWLPIRGRDTAAMVGIILMGLLLYALMAKKKRLALLTVLVTLGSAAFYVYHTDYAVRECVIEGLEGPGTRNPTFMACHTTADCEIQIKSHGITDVADQNISCVPSRYTPIPGAFCNTVEDCTQRLTKQENWTLHPLNSLNKITRCHRNTCEFLEISLNRFNVHG